MRLGDGEAARPTTRLRGLIETHRPLVVPGCFNAMSGRILEDAGFPALYMSGYGTSLNLLGLPDAGLATLTEMALNAKLIASAVRVPLIADADTGFGNAINVVRTVEEYIRAGVAGLHMEDQVAPKRCGHVAGREVIAREEAVLKIRAAARTRDALDRDFVIIARTDARGAGIVHGASGAGIAHGASGAGGGSLDEAILRANAFLEAGADLAFVEGPKDVAEVARIGAEVKGPVFYNMTGISPRLTVEQMAALGIRVCILPGAAMRATIMAIHDFAIALKQDGPMAEAAYDARFKQHPMGNLHGFAGFDRIREMEAEFLPEEAAQKYDGGLGYAPKAAE